MDRAYIKEFLQDKTALVVDDEPDVIESLLPILSRKFASADYATNGLEALEKIGVMQPDIILSDINMPTMDGITMCLECEKKYGALNIIFVTGYNNDEHTQKVEELGYRCISKPITMTILLETIVEVLQ